MHAARSPVVLGWLWKDRVSIGICYVVTIVITPSIRDPRFYAASSHPGGEAARVVIPSIILLAK